ncbi:MAG: glycosyl hydrolase family 18 protein [Anaerotruncus sp.]|nr:MAG: glycosyl hydrolase family 18 protein [Anaerotruncus sp.]
MLFGRCELQISAHFSLIRQAAASKLTAAEVYNIKSDNAKDLRVNAYLVASNINESTDFSMLDGVTDIIVFGTAKFDKSGSIIFVDDEGNTVDESVYAEKIRILKEAVGSRKINLICDVAMPYNDNNADIISMLSEENVDRTIESIKALVEKYDFDGYDMDYEFPNSKKEWKLFQFVFKAA